MAAIPVPRKGCIVFEVLTPAFVCDVGLETSLSLVIYVVTAIEHFRTRIWWIKKITQSRHGAVMKIRSTGPDRIQRLVGVTVGLAEMSEPIRRIGIERILVGSERQRVRIQAVRICSDLFNRHHDTDLRCILNNAIAETMVCMAIRAMLAVQSLALRGQLLIDWERILRRRKRPDPISHALEIGVIEGHRRSARTQGSAAIALIY